MGFNFNELITINQPPEPNKLDWNLQIPKTEWTELMYKLCLIIINIRSEIKFSEILFPTKGKTSTTAPLNQALQNHYQIGNNMEQYGISCEWMAKLDPGAVLI